MSVINTNITSMISQSNLNKSKGALTTAMERLSSGMRINSAKDDAAGQAIANRMTSQVRGLAQAQRNANDGISVAQTTEGALNQINDNLQRIRELTVQAQNGTNNSDDLGSIQNEIGQRLNEINRISEETNFNGVKVLQSDNKLQIQVGSQDGQTISIDLKQINAKTLGLDGFNVDGTGVTQNRTATVTDLQAAKGALNTTTGNYTVATTHKAATFEQVLSKMVSGNTVAVNTGGTTSVSYTFDAATQAFTYEATLTSNNTTAVTSFASDLLPPSGSTVSGKYEMAGGDVANFEVDATGKVTINGQAAYITANGELTTNDSGSGDAATLEGLLAASGATTSTLTIGSTEYSGGGNTLTYTANASLADVKTAMAASSSTGTTITLGSGLTTGNVSFGAGETTSNDVFVDTRGDLTATSTFNTIYAVDANTGAVTVAGGTGAGADKPQIGANVYVNSNGKLTTETTSKGDRTEDPLATLDSALKMVDALRSDLGAIQNRFESAITNLQTNETNLSAARSRIEDADYAKEVANMTRAQILQQAGTSVLAQANQVPQGVLSLLR